MAQQCSNMTSFSRGLQIIDFMLETENVTLEDAAKEFKLSKTTIRRDINLVGSEAFYGYPDNAEELKRKYVRVKKILESNNRALRKANR